MSRLAELAQRSPADVDAWTRAFAIDNAHRAGMSVRDWLDQFVSDQNAGPLPLDPFGTARFGRRSLVAHTMVAGVLAQPSPPAPLAIPLASAAMDEDDSHPTLDHGLDDITRALKAMTDEMKAVECDVHAGLKTEAAAPPPRQLSEDWLQASTEAIGRLADDVAHLIDIVECGFERVETAGARQSLALRDEISHALAELGERLDRVERAPIAAPALEAAPQPAPKLAADPAPEPSHLPAQFDSLPDLITETVAVGAPPRTVAEIDGAPTIAWDDDLEWVAVEPAAPAPEARAAADDPDLDDESLFDPDWRPSHLGPREQKDEIDLDPPVAAAPAPDVASEPDLEPEPDWTPETALEAPDGDPGTAPVFARPAETRTAFGWLGLRKRRAA